MKKIDRRIIIISALIFIVALSFGIMKFLIARKEEPPARSDKNTKRYVQSTMIRYGTVESAIEARGRLRSLSSIDIVAEASGKIIPGGVSLKKGASFNKGDLLFTVYRDEAELDLQGKKSSFMNTLANLLPDIKIDYPEYLETFTGFFRSLSINDDLPAMPLIEDEKLKIFLSSRNVLDEYYSIRKDELKLERHNIYAPFNGTYTDVYYEAGAYINTGGRVAHAIQTDILELEVPVKPVDAAWISAGDEVLVMRDADKAEYRGKVIRKGVFIDEDTQSQAVFIRIKNDLKKPLLNGEYLLAVFPSYKIEKAMEIPRNAVFNSDQVFIVNNDRLEKKRIDIIKLKERTLVFNGLNEGELIVTQPLVSVQEGIMVRTELNESEKDHQAVRQPAEKNEMNKGGSTAGSSGSSANKEVKQSANKGEKQ